METACLKIKFTPLIKKLRENDSKCCLEIVPEVTCLQNIDKMLQKQENSLYEYVIPITYKIILKKSTKCDTKHAGYEHNQIYHSCVDILHGPATSYYDETGDIKRFLSETVMFNKLPTSFHGWNMAIPQHEKLNFTPDEKITASTQTYEKRGEFTLTSSESRNLNKFYTTNSTDTDKEYCVMCNIDIQVDTIQNIVDVVNDVPEKGNQKICSKNINVLINEISKKCNINEMRKLSLTPICSINTNDMFMAEQNENNNNMGFVKDILYKYISPIMKPNMGTTYYMPLNECKPIEPYRNTPEMRIAEFQKLIEYEMLPLKYMLNDIVSKYASLNVDNQLKKSLLRTKKNHLIEKFSCQNRCRSNRVFYTIVFDD
ncbi:uncharacterized protein LOC134664489 [Cydia fagiglandana]|uniref:uncharacterized protein LOC134664489 n=1 Tax=Cydia fagiglandana TaxID=1458189 RepID=UPI002FEE4C54